MNLLTLLQLAWDATCLAFIHILLPLLEELYLVVGSEVDFRNKDVKLVG